MTKKRHKKITPVLKTRISINDLTQRDTGPEYVKDCEIKTQQKQVEQNNCLVRKKQNNIGAKTCWELKSTIPLSQPAWEGKGRMTDNPTKKKNKQTQAILTPGCVSEALQRKFAGLA